MVDGSSERRGYGGVGEVQHNDFLSKIDPQQTKSDGPSHGEVEPGMPTKCSEDPPACQVDGAFWFDEENRDPCPQSVP